MSEYVKISNKKAAFRTALFLGGTAAVTGALILEPLIVCGVLAVVFVSVVFLHFKYYSDRA